MSDQLDILTAFYSKHREELVEHATRFLHGNRMEAEDVVQNVFARLMRGNVLISTVTINGLVQTTMRRMLFDLWRRHQHVFDHERRLMSEDITMVDDVLSACSASQLNELLEKKMAQLAPATAKILRLSLFDEKPISEIAGEMDINYKTAEYQLATGRKALRQYIRKVI